jgi:hypothetical protein
MKKLAFAFIVLVSLACAVTVEASRAHRNVPQSTPLAVVATPDITLRTATRPARMTAAQALGIARANWPGDFGHGNPTAVRYANVDFPGLQMGNPGDYHAVGAENVWVVTVNGLNESRPSLGEINAAKVPPVHTHVWFIDDSTGQLIMSVGY